MDYLVDDYIVQRLKKVGVEESSRLESGAEVFLFELGKDFIRFARRRDMFYPVDKAPSVVVVKKQRPSIPRSEFASWVSSDPAERLRLDGYLAGSVSSYASEYRTRFDGKMPVIGSVVPIVIGGGYYVQKIAKGERLDRITQGSVFFRLYNFVSALAAFHVLMEPHDFSSLPSVDHQKELEVICNLNGWDFRQINSVCKPFLGEWKNDTLCHNTLHWKNIFRVAKKDFVVLDWEVPALNVCQDDLVRCLEGPYLINDEQRKSLLCVYYAASSLARNLTFWESKGFGIPIISYEEKMGDPYFRDFVYAYHMRCAVLNWWAFHHFKEQGKSNPESRMLASLDSLGRAAEIKNKRKISKLERVLLYAA